MQVWGALLILIICPLLGGLPLIRWITHAVSNRRLNHLGTGNLTVSAAFYHGGQVAGILAVCSEALKGVAAVLLARAFFPHAPAWEIMALIALVMGRYWMGKGAGTTNVVWGYVAHDGIAAFLIFLIGGISFTILRERTQAKFGVLVLLVLLAALLHPQESDRILLNLALAFLLGWIYTKIPDDLTLDSRLATSSRSRKMFKFFRGDRALRTLDQVLDSGKFGQKAATLAYLKRYGYPVPMGWVLAAGDDAQPLVELLKPSAQFPLIVRSSAVGEDSEIASAAGQYESVANITSSEALQAAINRCFASYDQAGATQYRRDRNLPETSMAVLVQQQIQGVFSGVVFSRDPIGRQGNAIVIEAMPGNATQVVSGQVTPETYQVILGDLPWSFSQHNSPEQQPTWLLSADLNPEVLGTGDVPPKLIQQVAYLARHLETHYNHIPQDIEWSYDGHVLWLLQARPVTTLLPIWTRKIASEVIPGSIHPLTWSINRPLTCGVWGTLFTLVLGKRAQDLDFQQTATLHYSRAYFNASLLGQIFRRMGLPPESLEFLTRGAEMSKPPLLSTLRNLPGLLRLAQREWNLETDFRRDDRHTFAPLLKQLSYKPAFDFSTTPLSRRKLLERIDQILKALELATYYSILAPLSAALRKALAKVEDDQLDNTATPEVAALRSLQELALTARRLLESQSEFAVLNRNQEPGTRNQKLADIQNPKSKIIRLSAHAEVQNPTQESEISSKLFATLAKSMEGQTILTRLDQIVNYYGYLSDVGTDIAIPTWQEQPQPVQDLFVQFCLHPPLSVPALPAKGRQVQQVQRRFDLKGKVTEIYSRLLAELRWSFVALERQSLELGWLKQPGDIFFLEFDEIRQWVESENPNLENPNAENNPLPSDLIAQRKANLERDRALESVPFLVYGNDPPTPHLTPAQPTTQPLQGIGASPGQVEGIIRIIHNLENLPEIGQDTIVVVPYTDSGWAPLLARASGLIAEVGGRLSHGAIIAREYRIPAVMDIHNATQLLHNGQRVRINGQTGIVELLSE